MGAGQSQHMVVGKAEKRGRDVEQVGGKKPHRAR